MSEAKLASFKTVGQIKALVHSLPGLLNSCGAFCKLRMCFPRSCYVLDKSARRQDQPKRATEARK